MHTSYPESYASFQIKQQDKDEWHEEAESSIYYSAAEDLTIHDMYADDSRDKNIHDLATHEDLRVIGTALSLEWSDGKHSDFELDETSAEDLAQVKKPSDKYFRQSRDVGTVLKHGQETYKALRTQDESTWAKAKGSLETEVTAVSTGPHPQPPSPGKVVYQSFKDRPKSDKLSNLTTGLETNRRSLLDSLSDTKAVSKDRAKMQPPDVPRYERLVPKGLISTRKSLGMPRTSHRLSTDDFGNHGSVKDWNDRQSACEPLQVVPLSTAPAKPGSSKKARCIFDMRKERMAQDFLEELDSKMACGEISRLTKLTGGVTIKWTKALNTTAGRANWRRESMPTKLLDGTVKVEYRHHASIELASKIVDDESRLFNVLAHEFCHLASYMISGVSNRPHGFEFQKWAAKCSQAFRDSHSVHVTTRHTYDIDFRYVWRCTICSREYQRHSRSINPGTHVCDVCKGTLEQIRPVPRVVKPSQYQLFFKEHIKIARSENPGSPHKDLMKIVAERWAIDKKKTESLANADTEAVDGVIDKMEQLSLVSKH